MDSVFWNPKCLSIVDSRGPFLEYLHDEGKLKIHRASVERLSGEGVHLDDGEILKADAVGLMMFKNFPEKLYLLIASFKLCCVLLKSH